MQRSKQAELKKKGFEDGRPRYEKGAFPVYDEAYAQLKKDSVYLNDKKRSNTLNRTGVMSGLGGCKRSVFELEGNENGMYKEGSTVYKAKIPTAKEALKDVYRDFKVWQEDQVKSGNALKPPKKWPDNHKEARLKAEARLDIHRAELFKVKNKLNVLQAQKRQSHIDQMLPNGPLGKGMNPKKGFKEGAKVDGQNIGFKNGLPFIDDEASPYHKMPVVFYKQMVYAWRQEIGVDIGPLDLKGLRAKRDEIFEQDRKEALKAGEEPPASKKVVTNNKLPLWLDRLGIGRKDWPEWPEDAKPVDEIE